VCQRNRLVPHYSRDEIPSAALASRPAQDNGIGADLEWKGAAGVLGNDVLSFQRAGAGSLSLCVLEMQRVVCLSFPRSISGAERAVGLVGTQHGFDRASDVAGLR
jgi:hypothetical protein